MVIYLKVSYLRFSKINGFLFSALNNFHLQVLSSEIDPAKISLVR
jgi:hypothetical protein